MVKMEIYKLPNFSKISLFFYFHFPAILSIAYNLFLFHLPATSLLLFHFAQWPWGLTIADRFTLACHLAYILVGQ